MARKEDMQKIVPHLWFDRDGAAAAELYTSLFPDSSIKSSSTIENTPSGTVETLSISLASQEFEFTPAVSLLVACESKAEVDRLWGALREGGSELMSLDAYPFSERYAWINDRFGLSWQIVPLALRRMMSSDDRHGVARVTAAFLKMKKFDIKALENVYGSQPTERRE